MKSLKGKGKKLAALVLALGMLLSLCAGALAEEYGVVINTDSLNLRSQGSSSSAWLGQYNRGTWVQIIGSQNNFYRVVTPDGKSGYMSKNYISITGGGYMTSRVALVTNQNGGAFLNFRAQPSYSAQVLGIFYYGVPLLVTGQTNGWYQVQINGQTGYVRSEYVTVSDQIASSTVATIKTPGNTPMNLRQGPGLQYDIIHQFSGDRYVMVLAQGSGWWHVSIDGYTGFMDSSFLTFGVKGLLQASKNVKDAMLFNVLSYMSNELLTNGHTAACIDEFYLFLTNLTAVEYIRNFMKRVRKKDSAVILASQNLEDFNIDGIREYTKPLFSIPTHVFLFNAGNIDSRFYIDTLQLEQSEYNLIRYPQRGVCLYKCGNERYNLMVHAPEYKEKLFGSAGGR